MGFDKPRLSISWNGNRHEHKERNRDGYASNISARISKPIGEQLDISIGLSHNREISDVDGTGIGAPDSAIHLPTDTFNLKMDRADLSAEYYLNANWSLPFSVAYLRGDFASTSRIHQSNFKHAYAISNDFALGDNWFFYRTEGHAINLSLSASRLLGDGSLLDFRASYTDAELTGGMNYDRTTAGISWRKRW